MILDKRQYYYYGNNYNSSWYNWGRWVLLGAIVLFVLFICLLVRCINARRIKRGGGPVRYTGWTVPSYGQSQQQYGYTNNQGYDMNNYPQQGQYQQTSYQGQPQNIPAPYGNGTYPEGHPAYYDASASQNPDSYQPPAYPPPATKPGTKPM